jgi:hypothetical protein
MGGISETRIGEELMVNGGFTSAGLRQLSIAIGMPQLGNLKFSTPPMRQPRQVQTQLSPDAFSPQGKEGTSARATRRRRLF